MGAKTDYHHTLGPLQARALHRGYRAFSRRRPVVPDLKMERFVVKGGGVIGAPLPKVGSRSVRKALRRHADQERFQIPMEPRDIRRTYPDAFVFSFVRNPWDRVYSCWKDKVDNAFSKGKIKILSKFPGLRPFMPFEEFLEWLSSDHGSDEIADRHWLSQVVHLDISGEVRLCDYTGRIETMGRDWQRISEITGLDLPALTHANAKPGADFASIYSARGRKIVERRYAADIEYFKYRFASEPG